MIEKIFGFNFYRVLIAIVIISILSAWQRIEEVKSIMFIVSLYLVLVFFRETYKAIRKWFTKS